MAFRSPEGLWVNDFPSHGWTDRQMCSIDGVVGDKVEGELPCVLVATKPFGLHSSARTGPDRMNHTHSREQFVFTVCVFMNVTYCL